jgi:MYXO-CTERM domain-containing protein
LVLAAGVSHELAVTFNPTALGPTTATLSLLTDEVEPSANTVRLDGRGVSWLLLNPAELVDFKNVARNDSVTHTVTLTNDSSAPIQLTEVSSVAAPFYITGLTASPTSPLTIAANSTIAFNVRFNPTSAGQFSTVLTLRSSAFNSPHSLQLKGTGTVPEVKLSLPGGALTASLDFKGVQVNVTKTMSVTITNTGGAEYISELPTLSSSSSAFTYKGPDSIRLAPGASMDLPISFRPASDIPYNDTLTIRSNVVSGQTTLSLTGFGANPKLEHSPSDIFFGDVRVGSVSAETAITVKNTGNAAVLLGPLPVVGPFEIVLPAGVKLPVEIPALNNFTFWVRFKPTEQGDKTGSVTINSDISNDTPRVVTLRGKGTVSAVQLFVTELDFGEQRVNSTSDTRSLTIKNSGDAELEITYFNFPSVFALSLPTGELALPMRISAGQQVPVYVTFKPKALGQVEGLLEIISNASAQAPSLALKGKGVDGRLSLTPPGPIDLGAVAVGASGTHKTVTLTNAGDNRLMISSVTPPTDRSFTVSGLLPGTPVEKQQSVSFTVTFKPETRGTFSTVAVINSDSELNPTFSVLLQGKGEAAAVVLEQTEINFGRANVGVTNNQTLSIKNEGERSLLVSSISFVDAESGAPGAALDFSVASDVEFPLTVEAGMSVAVPLRFTPGAVGERRARAIVNTNDKAAQVTVWGVGSSPNLEVTPSTLRLDFGNVVVGNPSAPRVIKLTNSGDGPLSVSELTVGGTDKTAFTVTSPTLPIQLPRGASTELSVTFKPDGERPSFSAQLLVKSTDPDAPSVTVSMSGAGVRQQIQLSESSLEFGQQLINYTSFPRELRVTNNSDTNVTLTALTLEGSGASQFSLARLPLPLILGPGQEQQLKLGVTLTPLAEADVNCTLKLTFSELQQPLEVALHGKGIPAVLSITPSPLDFGGVRIGAPKRELPLTLTNLSSDPITLAVPEVKYATGEPFLFDGDGLTGRTLEPGKSFILKVGYQPNVETLSETTLSLGTSTPQKPRAVDVQLKGRATKFLLSVDQGSLDFGWVKVSASVEPKVVTITNKSAQQQRVVVMLRDLEGSPFILDTKALAEPIAPGGTATFSVTFDPDKAGEAANEVQVWLQGDTAAEVLIPVKGIGRAITGSGGGCSCGSTEAGTAGLLAMLALMGMSSRRRRRE